MPTVDLIFTVRGGLVAVDHGYVLFSALAAKVPGLHERRDVRVFALAGQRRPGGVLGLETGTPRVKEWRT